MKKSMFSTVKRVLISSILLVATVASMTGCANAGGSKKTITASANYGNLQMTVIDHWEPFEDPTPFDLRFEYVNHGYVGVFVYPAEDMEAEETVAMDIYDFHVEDLMSRRVNVEQIEELQTIELEDRTIVREAYTGKYEDKDESAYYFHMIDFKESGDCVMIIQTCLPEDFDKLQQEFDDMVANATQE